MTESTNLHRQIPPDVGHVQYENGQMRIATNNFHPSSKDDGKLSVYNGEKFTAEASFEHYTANYKSVGVFSLAKQAFQSHDLEPNEDSDPFDGHVSVDYTSKLKPEIRNIAKKLRQTAVTDGWAFVPRTEQPLPPLQTQY